jgi:hypothetical protein
MRSQRFYRVGLRSALCNWTLGLAAASMLALGAVTLGTFVVIA